MNIVIVTSSDIYEHRADLLYDVITENGHKVKVFTSDFRHSEKIKRTEPKRDFIYFKTLPYQKNISYDRLHSHRKLSKDIFRYLDAQYGAIDLLWVLVPPNSFVKDAAEYKKRHPRTKLVLDLIDLWPESMPVGAIKNFFPFSVWRNIRDRYIKNADVVVTECRLYQKKLEKVLRGIRTEAVYWARPMLSYEPCLNLPDDRINLCYLGSINNIIDVDLIAKIISDFRRQMHVELHIIGDGERKDELIYSAEKAGATVIFHGKIYNRSEKQKIFDSCHFGLNIMKESVCVGLTMKSVDYMEFGLPLINNIKGDTWSIVESNRIGFNYSNNIDESAMIYSSEYRSNARSYFETHLTKEIFEKSVLNIIETEQ